WSNSREQSSETCKNRRASTNNLEIGAKRQGGQLLLSSLTRACIKLFFGSARGRAKARPYQERRLPTRLDGGASRTPCTRRCRSACFAPYRFAAVWSPDWQQREFATR